MDTFHCPAVFLCIYFIQSEGYRKINRDLCHAVQEVGDDFVTDDNEDVQHVGLGVSCCEKLLDRLGRRFAATDGGVAHEFGKRI